MAEPLQVEIVRPKQDPATRIATVVSPFAILAFRAWIVMLLAPQFWHPVGYWKSVAACLLVSYLVGGKGADYLRWTRDRK